MSSYTYGPYPASFFLKKTSFIGYEEAWDACKRFIHWLVLVFDSGWIRCFFISSFYFIYKRNQAGLILLIFELFLIRLRLSTRKAWSPREGNGRTVTLRHRNHSFGFKNCHADLWLKFFEIDNNALVCWTVIYALKLEAWFTGGLGNLVSNKHITR